MWATLLSWLFPSETPRSPWSLGGRAALWLFLLIWSGRYFVISLQALGEDPGWMHHVHLVFHEAGHAITAMVCTHQTTIVVMGSGLQVLFPLIVAGAFYGKNRDAFAAGLGLWWAGHALLDVAPYIADARALELPLLTGGTGREVEGHDWEYLLTQWNGLAQDTRIAATVALAGRCLMLLALVWALGALLYEGFFLPGKPAREVSEPLPPA